MLLRREFLAAPAVAMAQSPRKVKVAFLGASHAHGVAKLELVKSSPDYELAGVWEADAAARARLGRLGELRWMTKAEILGNASIEAVFLEGPVASHGPLALEALGAGKHCHIEKPAASRVAQMKQIVALAKSRRRVIQAGYMWRYNPAVAKALEAVKNGWLGEVFSVHIRINTNNGLGERVELGKFAGGQMFEMGAHAVDILVRMLGMPRRITPFLRHDGTFQDSFQDNAAAVLEYPKAMAVIVTSALHPNGTAHRALEIFGTNGSAMVRPIEPPALEFDLLNPAGPYSKGRQKLELPAYKRYVGDVAAFAKAVRGEAPLETTPDTEMAVTEVLLTASKMIG